MSSEQTSKFKCMTMNMSRRNTLSFKWFVKYLMVVIKMSLKNWKKKDVQSFTFPHTLNIMFKSDNFNTFVTKTYRF
jgi:hypothetical protein